MSIQSLISTLILMSALLFVDRIFSLYKKQQLLSEKFMTKIGTFYFIFLISLYFYSFSHPFSFWIFTFASFFVFPTLLYFLNRIHQQQFYSEFLRFLSLIIMNMQQGLAFVTAIERAQESGNWKQGQVLGRICENVVFSQQTNLSNQGFFNQFLGSALIEMRQIHRQQHQGIERLKNLRKILRERLTFRQRSRQIWLYFSYQLGLLSLIYWSLFLYILKDFGFFGFQSTFLYSASLYFMGSAVTFFIAKGKKWSI
jgi:Flp pilus assembly protein TadB